MPDVHQQVAGRGHGQVPGPGELAERVQLGRARTGEQAVPRVRAHTHHAGKVIPRGAETDRPLQPGPVGKQVPAGRLPALIDGEHQEDRRVGERTEHRLRNRLSAS